VIVGQATATVSATPSEVFEFVLDDFIGDAFLVFASEIRTASGARLRVDHDA